MTPPPAAPTDDPIVDPSRVETVERAAAVTDTIEAAPGLDRLVRLVARILDVPLAMVSFLDADREHIIAAVGVPEPWASARATPLTHSICAFVVRSAGPMVIYDAHADPRMRDHAAVVEMGAGAYAGFPLRHGRHVLGAFCAADFAARRWTPEDLELLEDFAAAVSAELSLRIDLHDAQTAEQELQRLSDELREQSYTDPLTGIANRRAFEERLAEEAARLERHPGQLSLVLLDVDDFKRINDTAGHPAGDAVLIEVAARLRSVLRRSDLLSRVGGDEFAVLLPDTGPEAAAQLVRRIRHVLSATPVDGHAVTASTGVATHRPEAGAKQLVAEADEALYAAKARRSAPPPA